MALPFRLRRQNPPRVVIAGVLEQLGLEHRRLARPVSLSGGEQQRVALARVLVADPQVVFADEPTGALDERSGVVVMEALREVASRPDRTVVVVTHDARVADRCDGVTRLRDGAVVSSGAPPAASKTASGAS